MRMLHISSSEHTHHRQFPQQVDRLPPEKLDQPELVQYATVMLTVAGNDTHQKNAGL